MVTLNEIHFQSLRSLHEKKLLKALQVKYVEENSKFKVGDIVKFKQFSEDTTFRQGKVFRIYFEEEEDSPIQYCLLRVNKDGTPNKNDRSFYYKNERLVTL